MFARLLLHPQLPPLLFSFLQNASASAPIKRLKMTKKRVFEHKQRCLKWLNRGGLKKAEKRREGEKKERWREWQSNRLALLFLMMRLEDPGEPLPLIDVKCVISLLIKAETSNTENKGKSERASEREREGETHLFDGNRSSAPDAVGSSFQAFFLLVRLARLPRLQSR